MIARLQKELGAAREALSTLKPQGIVSNGLPSYGSAPAVPEEQEVLGIPEDVLEKVCLLQSCFGM